MKITILVDNPKSWFVPYAETLKDTLLVKKHEVRLVHSERDIQSGDCLFLLSCERIVPPKVLALHTHNIVIHASKLPNGRGFAPLIWQVLEGKRKIYFTLFEAEEKVDAGRIYFQEYVMLEGHELHEELRDIQARKTIELAVKFISQYRELKLKKQSGKRSWYRRRTPKDNELDIDKSIKRQFNLLRVSDNERYPAFFRYRGYTYYVKIYKNP